MKNKIARFILAMSAFTVIVLPTVANGALVGHWTFDDVLTDSAGTANGVFSDGTPSYEPGQYGNAITLDGVNDHVVLGDSSDFNFGNSADFSVCLWVKTAGSSSDIAIMSNKDWYSGANTGWLLGNNYGNGTWNWNYKGASGVRLDYFSSGNYINDSLWHHLCVTHDRDGFATFYFDGVFESQMDMSGSNGTIDVGYPTVIGTDGAEGSAWPYWFGGAVDDARIYDHILSQAEIDTLVPATATATIDVGPYVQFTSPTEAVIRWDTFTAMDSIVEYGPTTSLGQRVSDATLTTSHEITITGLKYRHKNYYRVGGTVDAEEVFTGAIIADSAINYSKLDMSGIASPYPVDSMTPVYEAAADRIIAQSGITSGFCLDYGCGTGRLAFEVAKRSNLTIIGIETDSAKIATARSELLEAGVYGARVKVRECSDLTNTTLPKNLFNLIISDSMITDSACVGSSTEMFRVLRPDGGIAYLGQPSGSLGQATLEAWLDAGSITYTTTNDGNGLWSKVDKAPTAGSGEWVRGWGDLGNSGNSFDEIEGASSVSDLRVHWLGAPGEDFGFDRQPRMPTPSMKNGFLYHQGYNRLLSMDSYNGSIHWSLEMPGLLRVNAPRDTGIMCADTDGLFVALDDDCLYFDGATGQRTITHALNDDGKEWGYVAVSGNNLIGSAQYDNSYHTTLWGTPGWADATSGVQTNKVCSKYMFANNKTTGARVWTDTRAQRGTLINSTIAIGGGRVYFVESRDATVNALTNGNIGISELWNSLYLVALNENTGSPIFEQSINVADGIVVFYLQYYAEKLFLTASSTRYDIYCYDATNGGSNWNETQNWVGSDHGKHMQHPVIVNNVLYLVPNGYNVSNGSTVTSNVGVHTKCATYGGTKNFLVYRGVGINLTMWDFATETQTYWPNLRSSCWLNHISGGGMYLAPEGAAGCSCGGWINTSIGFVRDN
jgi:SAM-dependent methyltransferase